MSYDDIRHQVMSWELDWGIDLSGPERHDLAEKLGDRLEAAERREQTRRAHYEQLKERRNELQANCERLRECGNRVRRELGQWALTESDPESSRAMTEWDAALNETPAQSLCEIRAEAVEEAAEALNFSEDGLVNDQDLYDYAKDIRSGE